MNMHYMEAFHTVVFHYPDTGPVKFLLYMLGVIAFGIWLGMKEDK
jgi:hypothetical protein